jgi:hypothetical protein
MEPPHVGCYEIQGRILAVTTVIVSTNIQPQCGLHHHRRQLTQRFQRWSELRLATRRSRTRVTATPGGLTKSLQDFTLANFLVCEDRPADPAAAIYKDVIG